MSFKWKPSKAAKQEFANKMCEIDTFCKNNNIAKSLSGNSYYFNINGKSIRVSNHTVNTSDKGMFNEFGEKIRNSYHPESYDIEITASKTRIIEIYKNLKKGLQLDKRGNLKK